MQSMQTTLRGMAWNPVADEAIGNIHSDAIVIRKPMMAAKESETRLPHIRTPGLVITPPKTISTPMELGTNSRDDILYHILVQLVDSDNGDRERGLATYIDWIERIRKAFNCHSFTNVPVEVGCGNGYATTTDTVDEKLWSRESLFVSGVVVTVRSRETRGIEL